MRENVFSSLSTLFLSVFQVANAWLDCGCGGDGGDLLFFANLSVLKALRLLSTRRLAQRTCLIE
ncbi:hypothetical protein HKD37_14G040076 [Glycine soja]